jgi:hypothetical protein
MLQARDLLKTGNVNDLTIIAPINFRGRKAARGN